MAASTFGDAFWPIFVGLIAVLWGLDFALFRQGRLRTNRRLALKANLIWLASAGILAALLGYFESSDSAITFAAAFLAGKAISLGEVFIFYLVVRALAMPDVVVRRVLFNTFIFAALATASALGLGYLLAPDALWIPAVVGTVTALMALQFLLRSDRPEDVTGHWAVRIICRVFSFSEQLPPRRFFVVEDGRRKGTRLALTTAIFAVSVAVFALSAFAASFGVTADAKIGIAGALMGMVGIRSLFFAVAGWGHVLRAMKPALTLTYGYAGVATLASPWLRIEPWISLVVFAAIWSTGFVSLWYGAHTVRPRTTSR